MVYKYETNYSLAKIKLNFGVNIPFFNPYVESAKNAPLDFCSFF